LYCAATASLFYRYLLKLLANFSRKIIVSRNLSENHKSRQNTANPNISRVFGSGGFIFRKKIGWEV